MVENIIIGMLTWFPLLSLGTIKSWKVYIIGWNLQKVTIEQNNETLKLGKDWSKEEDEEKFGNSLVLNAIYKLIDKNIFRTINTCTSAKECWETLQTVNNSFSLIEKISGEKIDRRILISIPKRFDKKVTIIEEA